MSPYSPTTVILLHTLPDGSSHYDWLMETSPDDPLLTFRIQDRLPQLGVGAEVLAVRAADHRRIYLDFEGEISENRGRVERIGRGVSALTQRPSELEVCIWWEGGHLPQRWVGERVGESTPEQWRFVSLSLAP